MSILRIYENSGLTTMVTIDGDYSNPDDSSGLDGTNGETSKKQLWLAVEQTTLGAAISDTTGTTITLSAARFSGTDYDVIICESEKMLITAGHGTTSLTVIRGHNGTTAATHTNGTAVYAAYDCTSATVDCIDETDTDESGWVTYSDTENGSYTAPYTFTTGTFSTSTSETFWRKVVVPASTAAAYKRDLIHRVTATINEST